MPKKRKPGRPPIPASRKVTRIVMSFLPEEAAALKKIGNGDVRTGIYRLVIAKTKGAVRK